MAAGWGAFKDFAMRKPPMTLLDTRHGPIQRDFQLRWIQGKRENAKERQLIAWISVITGETVPQYVEFGQALRDGVLLCKLMNKIQPGSVRRIQLRGDYALRENVGNFISACKRYGLREEDCFTSTDLCDRADLSVVASTLFSLAELAHSRDQNIPLP